MKRTLIATAVILALVACATFLRPGKPHLPGVVVIHAQSLPITKTLTWDPNAASDGVLNYVVRLDGTVIGSPTGTTQVFTIVAAGAHTLTVVAVNMWGDSLPATLAVDVRVPGAPGGLRIQ